MSDSSEEGEGKPRPIKAASVPKQQPVTRINLEESIHHQEDREPKVMFGIPKKTTTKKPKK